MFFTPPRLRRFYGLCLIRSLRAVAFPLRAQKFFKDPGLLAGSSRRETQLRSGHLQLQLKPSGSLRLAQGIETFPDA